MALPTFQRLWHINFFFFYIKVRDKCADDVNHTVHRIAYRESNKFNDNIAKGKFTEAIDLAISVLSLLEKRKRCDSLKVG